MPPPGWAEELYHAIAVPRLVGGPEVQRAIDLLHDRLERLGYRVRRHPVSVSSQRPAAVSVLGFGFAACLVGLAPLLLLPGDPRWVVGAWVVGCAALGLLVWGMAGERLPWPRSARRTENLEGRRGDPRLWVVAHSDSKAQRFSVRGRVIAAVTALAGGAGVLGLLVARAWGPTPWWGVVPLVVAGAAGGAALGAATPRDGSPGAVDNASGLIAALVAAEQLRDRTDVGVLITGAEEWGMQGARAWVAARPTPAWFVNLDGLDARGPYRVMCHGRAARLASAVSAHLGASRTAVRVARLPLGILVDGAVLAGAGWRGLTVSRGDWRTLAVVHTGHDRPARVPVEVAVETGVAVARALREVLS